MIEATEHCAVTVANDAASATGAVVSVIVTVWFWVDVFPTASVYVQVTVVFP
ncbi:hypothetical protein D3C86_2095220 [compost metagenome]